jgi:hypothetical protein
MALGFLFLCIVKVMLSCICLSNLIANVVLRFKYYINVYIVQTFAFVYIFIRPSMTPMFPLPCALPLTI